MEKEGKLVYKYGKAEWPVKKVGSNRFSFTPTPLGPQEFVLIPGKSGKTEYLHIWGEIAKKTPPVAARTGGATPTRN
jgi:hypothetical protein